MSQRSRRLYKYSTLKRSNPCESFGFYEDFFILIKIHFLNSTQNKNICM